MTNLKEKRLETYTIKRPQEVLLITTKSEDQEDQIVIFKGFSSSVMQQTSYDPDIPVLSDDANIIQIDIVTSPYNPDTPHYLQKGLSWPQMEALLAKVGL